MLIYVWRHRLVGTTCFVFLILTLAFCTWRIWETSHWLQAHRAYVHRHDQDMASFLARIEARIDRQDEDIRAIRDDLSRLAPGPR